MVGNAHPTRKNLCNLGSRVHVNPEPLTQERTNLYLRKYCRTQQSMRVENSGMRQPQGNSDQTILLFIKQKHALCQ